MISLSFPVPYPRSPFRNDASPCQVMIDDAVAFKGQLCSVMFVSGCLILLPFAVVMEGALVRGRGYSRADVVDRVLGCRRVHIPLVSSPGRNSVLGQCTAIVSVVILSRSP